MTTYRPTRRNLLAGLAVAAIAGGATAQSQPDAQTSPTGKEAYVLTDIYAKSSCNDQTAAAVTVANLASGRVVADCVAVEGFQSGRALYSTMAAAQKEHTPREVSRDRVGLYGDYDAVRGVVRVRLIGTPNSCAELVKGPGVIMVLGYCHTDHGYVLATPRRVN